MDANAVEWTSVEHALRYLARADSLPHRVEGEAALLEHLPEPADRVLDIGTGDGRLLALVLAARPDATGVAVDFSPTMLDAARSRFANSNRVEVLEHDLGQTLATLGTFDAVVSSFAIHHCSNERKRALYGEVLALLILGGVFLNLEHVASPTDRPMMPSSLPSATPERPRTAPTSCSMSRRSSGGCATSASTTSTATGNGGSWPFLEDPCRQRQPPYRHADHDKERAPFGSRNLPERSCKPSPNPNSQPPLIFMPARSDTGQLRLWS